MSVRVTAAPGCHFAIHPHPSGLPGLPALLVHGGEAVTVPEARADALFRAGLILHPATGALPPKPEAARDGVHVVAGPERSVAISGGDPSRMSIPMWQPEDAALPDNTNRQRVPRPYAGGFRPLPPQVTMDTFADAMRDSYAPTAEIS